MKSVVQDSIRFLQAQGYRVTEPRRRVLEVLEGAQVPLSPYDIQRTLRVQGKCPNHVTIYRVLRLLCRLNLAHRILSKGGFVKCTLERREGCHRLMICRCCGALQEFSSDGLCREESEIAGQCGFHAEHHTSESSGLCSTCYRKQSADNLES
jgi:Fur family zinc uptake transcriptional regulator